jgi:hypothetical protein
VEDLMKNKKGKFISETKDLPLYIRNKLIDNMDEETLLKTHKMLVDIHKQRIDMSDEIFVINVGGYIGKNTKSEIEYAIKKGKKVNYLES